MLLATILVAISGICVAQTQVAAKRVALLMANGGYPDAGLPQQTAAKDAAVLSDELNRDGFDVDLQKDLNHAGMQAAIDAFLAKIDQGSTALLYFNGAGIQVSRQTYLIPVNAEIWSEADVKREGISVDAVVADMNRRGASVKIIVIDASRRNPYERRFRAYSAGLASLDAPDNSLVMYAAAPNRIAPDSTGDVSLFMNELVKELRTPNISAEDAIMHTRVGVARASNGEQVPWFASSLVDPIFLGHVTTPPADVPPADSIETPVPVAKVPAPVPPPDTSAPPATVPEHVAKAPVAAPPAETNSPPATAPNVSPPGADTTPAPVAKAPTAPPPVDPNIAPAAKPPTPVPSQDAGSNPAPPAKPPETPQSADAGLSPSAKPPAAIPPQAPPSSPQEANGVPAAKEPPASTPQVSPTSPQEANATPAPETKAPSSPPQEPPAPPTSAPPASPPSDSNTNAGPGPNQSSPTSGPPPDQPPAPPDDRPGTVFRDCPDCPDMTVLAPGSFFMGSGKTPFERPIHRITLPKPFAIGQTEVTFADWARCLDAGGCTSKPDNQGFGEGDHPVINISWSDAEEYVAWLSRRTGKAYRLPSEAEWEFAARGGSMTTFAWGPMVGSHNANCSECGNDVDAPHTFPVKSFPPNGYGLFDMAGNAAEWVEDCWNASYAGAPTDGSPWLTGTCEQRVLRGGSFDSGALYVRPAARFRYDSDVRYWANGFRVARDVP